MNESASTSIVLPRQIMTSLLDEFSKLDGDVSTTNDEDGTLVVYAA